MKRALALAAALGLVAGATALLGGPAGAAVTAATPTTTVQAMAPFGFESWYQPQESCNVPVVGCMGAPAPDSDPYGAGILHAGAALGSETSRSYLNLAKVASLPGKLTNAVLTVPSDESSMTNGSLQASTAKIVVCTADATAAADRGSFAAPPTTDCSLSVTLFYNAAVTPPVFSGNIDALLPKISAGLTSGTVSLGVLPYVTPPSATNTGAFSVAFSAHDRDMPPTPPASLQLTFATTATASATPSAAKTSTAAPTSEAAPTSAAPTSAAATKARPSATPTKKATTSPTPAAKTTTAAALPSSPPTTSAPAAVAVQPPVQAVIPTLPLATDPPAAAVAPSPEVVSPEADIRAAATTEATAQQDTGTVTQATTPARAQTFAPTLAASRRTGYSYPAALLLPFALLALGYVVVRVMRSDVSRPTPGGPRA